ncbi:excalibur calcium-binding domain-containing protein [Rhodococcus wratislaviensis]
MRGSGGCGTSAYYSKCADARAAGAAPLYGPGYRSELDRDDGVACE